MPRGPRACDARDIPVPGRACKEKAAWSSGVMTCLRSFSVDPVSQQDGVFLVSSTFGGAYPRAGPEAECSWPQLGGGG